MLAARKQQMLQGILAKLPDHMALRLAKAIEVDRLAGGALPHNECLQTLRPQLRRLDPTMQTTARTLTPQRVFCMPFEDLLIDGLRTAKQRGRILRSSTGPVWAWLAQTGMPERHKFLCDGLRAAVLQGRYPALAQLSEDLWRESAEALSAMPEDDAKFARVLGGHYIAEDAAEMALLLSAGKEIAALQTQLPRPIPSLDDAQRSVLREAFDRLDEENPDLAPYVAVIAMGRLARPWEVLRFTGRNATGMSSEILFGDLDRYVENMRAVRMQDFDPEILLQNLGAFAELSSGMSKEFRRLGIREDGPWGKRLSKVRSTASQTMEILLERAAKEIAAALPPVRPGGFGHSPKPIDITHVPDAKRISRAKQYAYVLDQARPFSVAAAFRAKLDMAAEDCATFLREMSEDLLREIHSEDAGKHAHAETYFGVLLDLAAMVLGEEETSHLRRRSRALASAST